MDWLRSKVRSSDRAFWGLRIALILGRMLIVRSAATDSLAEGDEVFVIADPRSCVLLEE